MKGFDSHVVVESVSPDFWRLHRDLHWTGDLRIVVPAGFDTDFESVPAFSALFGFRPDDYPEAGALHDYLYYTQDFTRRTADRQLWLALRDTGCPRLKAFLTWWMVRLFGWLAWRQDAVKRLQRLQKSIQSAG